MEKVRIEVELLERDEKGVLVKGEDPGAEAGAPEQGDGGGLPGAGGANPVRAGVERGERVGLTAPGGQ